MEDVKQWHLAELAGMYKKCIGIVLERSQKYATDEDPFLNFKRGAAFANTSVEAGIMTRIGDKLSRLQNALEKEDDDDFSDESFDDTIADLCNYFVILRNYRLLTRIEAAPEQQLELFVDEEAKEENPGVIKSLAKRLGVTVS